MAKPTQNGVTVPSMVKRVGFSFLAVVALAAFTPAPAAASHSISVDGAKRAIRAALHSDFEGGVKQGSIRWDCGRDGKGIRCEIDFDNRRGRAWCGRATTQPAHGTKDGARLRTVTRFRVHRPCHS